MNIRIYTKNIELTPEVEKYVNDKIEGLSKFIDSVLEVRVEISKTTLHHRHGEIFYAEVNMTVPGRLIRSVAKRKNLWLAIDEVRDELQGEIKKYKGKQKAKFLRGSRFMKHFKSIDPLALIRKIRYKERRRDE